MHREPLLQLIDTYAGKYPDEQECVDRFRAFVREQPQCFERSLGVGHVTGSAWIVNAANTSTLLTHHAKLNIWLQLGGHADGDADVLNVALREGLEESGLPGLHPVSPEIFDLDIHGIPARGDTPRHDHYDVRFLLQATETEEFVVSDESHALGWIAHDDLEDYTTEVSMLRMARKWRAG